MQASKYKKKISHPKKRVAPIRFHEGVPVSLAIPFRRGSGVLRQELVHLLLSKGASPRASEDTGSAHFVSVPATVCNPGAVRCVLSSYTLCRLSGKGLSCGGDLMFRHLMGFCVLLLP